MPVDVLAAGRVISIHALREEGDLTYPPLVSNEKYFYPRPPRGGRRRRARRTLQGLYFYPRPPRGGRQVAHPTLNVLQKFLSTPSARRATHGRAGKGRSRPISIHALREEGDSSPKRVCAASSNFYPRPPRGGRQWARITIRGIIKFLSTPSARRATVFHGACNVILCNFYPRPPRGGRPSRYPGVMRKFHYFYPRPPRGGRPSAGLNGDIYL